MNQERKHAKYTRNYSKQGRRSAKNYAKQEKMYPNKEERNYSRVYAQNEPINYTNVQEKKQEGIGKKFSTKEYISQAETSKKGKEYLETKYTKEVARNQARKYAQYIASKKARMYGRKIARTKAINCVPIIPKNKAKNQARLYASKQQCTKQKRCNKSNN